MTCRLGYPACAVESIHAHECVRCGSPMLMTEIADCAIYCYGCADEDETRAVRGVLP